MGTSPQEAFSEFVVHTALESMGNTTRVSLAHGIQNRKGRIEMDTENVRRALKIYEENNPGIEGQIEITFPLLQEITKRLTATILNEGNILSRADAIGPNKALFTSGEVMDYA